jgi:hypothetical protein
MGRERPLDLLHCNLSFLTFLPRRGLPLIEEEAYEQQSTPEGFSVKQFRKPLRGEAYTDIIILY